MDTRYIIQVENDKMWEEIVLFLTDKYGKDNCYIAEKTVARYDTASTNQVLHIFRKPVKLTKTQIALLAIITHKFGKNGFYWKNIKGKLWYENGFSTATFKTLWSKGFVRIEDANEIVDKWNYQYKEAFINFDEDNPRLDAFLTLAQSPGNPQELIKQQINNFLKRRNRTI